MVTGIVKVGELADLSSEVGVMYLRRKVWELRDCGRKIFRFSPLHFVP